MATKYPINLVPGKKFVLPIRWEQKNIFVSKAITEISIANGPPRLTVTGHGMPSGWRCFVTRVQGMKQINAPDGGKRDSDYQVGTVIDANTIEFNEVVPVDDSGREWPAYESGGILTYHQPKSLAGLTVRVKFNEREDGEGAVLLSTDAVDAPLDVIAATPDDASKVILVEIGATTTAALAWKKGFWEVEGELTADDVEPIIAPSSVTVGKEVAK